VIGNLGLATLAGRAADEVIFKNVSASAGGKEDSDLTRATMLAIRSASPPRAPQTRR
jgi:hypothetical protein